MAASFKLDENLPRDALALLLEAGKEADSVIEEQLGGGPDRKVLDACGEENRVLITLDLDFADIRALSAGEPSRRLGAPSTYSEYREHTFPPAGSPCPLGHGPTDNRLWIVEQGSVRIRE